ncbi:MAG TPA: HlyD family efflux transporter periplasmic adaptor subunit [Myxococcales bacterium LLY-WYZ-16_1]|nr:HlyD family efflux transporter periplasmic adaptor subunit [Myxococcales bacterium LLY-WYZ-16_1]
MAEAEAARGADWVPPAARSDLVIRPDPEDDAYGVVKDPVRGTFFRFNEIQIFLIASLNGNRSLEELQDALGEEFGFEMSFEKIERFVGRLRKDYLLELSQYRCADDAELRAIRRVVSRTWPRDGQLEAIRHRVETEDPLALLPDLERAAESGSYDAASMAARIATAYLDRRRGNPSHLKMVKLWDPDRFLTVWNRRIGDWIFSPFGILTTVGLLVWALVPLVDLNWNEALRFDLWDVLWCIPLFALFFATHELGHGFACKHYGGEVRDMGVMLFYWVVPAAYCDTSDTYLFSNRNHKVVTMLAGLWVSFTFDAILLLIHHHTSDAFFLHDACLLMVLITLVELFANLIPFVPQDGYFALADFVGVANLREKALGRMRALAARVLMAMPTDSTSDGDRHWIVLPFGLGTLAYTVAFVYGIWFTFLFPLAIYYLGTVGVVLVAYYGFGFFRNFALRPLWEGIRYAWVHRSALLHPPRAVWVATWMTAVVALLTMKMPLWVDGRFTLDPVERARVASKVDGRLHETWVADGEPVQAGQPLFRLEAPKLELRLAEARASLRRQQARLRLLERGARPEELEMLEAEVRQAFTTRQALKRAFFRTSELRKGRLATDGEVERRRTRMLVQGDVLRGRRASLDQAAEGARGTELSRQRALVDRALERVRRLETTVENLVVRSPLNGRFSFPSLEESVGRWVTAGHPLGEVLKNGRRLRIAVPAHTFAAWVRPGQTVWAKAHGSPHVRIEGTVARISPAVRPNAATEVQTSVVNVPPRVPADATGRCRIFGAPRSVGYQFLWYPLARLVAYSAWTLFGSV